MIIVYCSERIYIKIRKKQMGQGPGETRCKLPKVLSQWSCMDALNSLSKDVWQHMWKCCQPGKLTWALMSRIFIDGQSWRHVVPAWLTYSDSRSPVEKEAFIINYIVSTDCLTKMILHGPRPQADNTSYSKGFRAHLPGAGHRPFLKTRLFWECAGFQ